jgi:hypothetical protein
LKNVTAMETGTRPSVSAFVWMVRPDDRAFQKESADRLGTACMFQNNDRVITVPMATVSSADGARGLFNAKKRIVSGADVPGWVAPAYAGFMRAAAVVGVISR